MVVMALAQEQLSSVSEARGWSDALFHPNAFFMYHKSLCFFFFASGRTVLLWRLKVPNGPCKMNVMIVMMLPWSSCISVLEKLQRVGQTRQRQRQALRNRPMIHDGKSLVSTFALAVGHAAI